MGAIHPNDHLRFRAVNHYNSSNYDDAMVSHHLIPRQSIRDVSTGSFLLALGKVGFQIDDFATNGMLLPSSRRKSEITGLPLHIGGHPKYNQRLMIQLDAIRVFSESVRSDSLRLRFALAAVRGLQKRTRTAIANQCCGLVDWVQIDGPSARDLIAQIDLSLAARTNSSN